MADTKVPEAALIALRYQQMPQVLVGMPIGAATINGQVVASNDSQTSAAIVGAGASAEQFQVVVEPPVLFGQQTFQGNFYLPYNPNRVYLLIQNQDATTLYVQFTGQNGTFDTGLQIAAAGYYEPYKAPINAVAGSGAAGFVIEGIRQPVNTNPQLGNTNFNQGTQASQVLALGRTPGT